MTEWEQIKKEYREIPVPEDGSRRALEAMAEAKRKRSHFKTLTRYGTVAAAALLVVLLVPGKRLFSGGFPMSMKSNYGEYDCQAESTGSEEPRGLRNEAVGMPSMADGLSDTQSIYYSAGGGDVNDSAAVQEKKEEAAVIWAGEEEAVSREILRQMEERMQAGGETYYIRSEAYSEGFVQISDKQEYYINEEGLLVVVFQEGTVAPKEQGVIEFIIPAEVFVP